MKKAPSVLLYATDPKFFERRDTWFNRRGVDVFCSMTGPELVSIAKSRQLSLIVSRGIPGAMTSPQLRRFIPAELPVLVLATGGDHPDLLAEYEAHKASAVLHPPYEDKVMRATAAALKVPVRHYLRMLVQLRVGTNRGFGFSNNVSASGLLLETRSTMTIGTEIDVSFMLPGAQTMTQVTGRVVRDAGPGQSGSNRYGVHFLDITAEDQNRIRSMVEEAESQSPPALPA